MATRIPNPSRSAALKAITDLLNAGSGPGVVEIRTGAQPASADDAATGILLATLPLSDPAFADPVDGVAAADVTPEPEDSAADADGTAGWYRASDSDGNPVLDGSVTVTDGGGDMEMNTTALVLGVAVKVTSWQLTMPGA